MTYEIGVVAAGGKSKRHYAPDGEAWCAFGVGSLDCINGPYCLNPNHHRSCLTISARNILNFMLGGEVIAES